jgi:hypothetical protein
VTEKVTLEPKHNEKRYRKRLDLAIGTKPRPKPKSEPVTGKKKK